MSGEAGAMMERDGVERMGVGMGMDDEMDNDIDVVSGPNGTAPALPMSASGAGSARPKSPIVHGSYEKADSDDEEVMVKTEFVWADGAELDVKLSGAWNGWMPVQMYHEGGKYFNI